MTLKLLHLGQPNLLFLVLKISIGLSEGCRKKGDKIKLSKLKKNISKCYLIGKNTNFFKRQLQNKLFLQRQKL